MKKMYYYFSCDNSNGIPLRSLPSIGQKGLFLTTVIILFSLVANAYQHLEGEVQQNIAATNFNSQENFLKSGQLSASSDATLIFSEDFDNGDISLPCSGNCPTVTSNPVRKGQYSMKTYLHCTESPTNYRTEVSMAGKEDNIGEEYWYGFSIFLPDDYIPDRTWEIVAQWHGRPDGYPDFAPGTEYWRNPLLCLASTNGEWTVNSIWDSKANTGDKDNRQYEGSQKWELGAYETGKWTDWVFRMKWSYHSDGILEVWKDGELVISKNGPNCFNDKIGPYFKLGLYKGWQNWWNYSSDSWWKHDVADERTLYHDELKVAHGENGYDLVSPGAPKSEEEENDNSNQAPVERTISETTYFGEKISFKDAEAGVDTELGEGVHTFPYTHDGISKILTVTVTGIPRVLSISEVQGNSDSSPWVGSQISVMGTITHVVNNVGIFMQDANAPRSGIWVSTKETSGLSEGKGVVVDGTIVEDARYFENVTTLVASEISTGTSDLNVEAIIVGSPTEAKNEKYESVLVTVKSVTAGEPDQTTGAWIATSGNEEIIVNDWLFSFSPTVGNLYDVTGVVNGQNDLYKIEPRKTVDLNILKSSQVIYSYEDISICDGDSYKGWTISGQYQRVLQATSGEDSIVYTTLTVNSTYSKIEEINISSGENYNGWTQSGEYVRNLTSIHGCDSTITTRLTVTTGSSSGGSGGSGGGSGGSGGSSGGSSGKVYATEEIYICEGNSYKGWTTAGQYERTLKTASGQDSIITTNLWVNPVYSRSEIISIYEGENYHGWTESGQYFRTLSSASGCDSTIITVLTVIIPTHFNTTWDNIDDQNFMSLHISGASLNSIPLEKDDEIAVFDGDKCVGLIRLDSPIDPNNSASHVQIKVAKDNGDGNGFSEGNTISFKIWDKSAETEIAANQVNYKSDIISWITDGKFTNNGTAVAEVSFMEEEEIFTQQINLNKGWNIFSSYLTPSALEMDSVLQSLLMNGNLIKIQDESDNTHVNDNSKNGWINHIGEIRETEGYKVRVESDCVLEINGSMIELPLNIDLQEGWNLISFPQTQSTDAMEVIGSLMDAGILEKVQDERGNSIEYWANSIGWINGIGNFSPGEGYKIKVNSPGILRINEAYEKNADATDSFFEPIYFSKDFEGNGFDHMNINVVGLLETGIQIGDEIAAFDGDICVGITKITDMHLVNNAVSIVASKCDVDVNNGFSDGNSIQLKIWNNAEDVEYDANTEVLSGELSFSNHSSVFVSLLERNPIEDEELTSMELHLYPNPTSDYVNVEFNSLPEIGTTLVLTDLNGKKLLAREVTNSVERIDVQTFPNGTYLLRAILNGKSKTEPDRFIIR